MSGSAKGLIPTTANLAAWTASFRTLWRGVVKLNLGGLPASPGALSGGPGILNCRDYDGLNVLPSHHLLKLG
jgi:hypothetical protein